MYQKMLFFNFNNFQLRQDITTGWKVFSNLTWKKAVQDLESICFGLIGQGEGITDYGIKEIFSLLKDRNSWHYQKILGGWED